MDEDATLDSALEQADNHAKRINTPFDQIIFDDPDEEEDDDEDDE